MPERVGNPSAPLRGAADRDVCAGRDRGAVFFRVVQGNVGCLSLVHCSRYCFIGEVI